MELLHYQLMLARVSQPVLGGQTTAANFRAAKVRRHEIDIAPLANDFFRRTLFVLRLVAIATEDHNLGQFRFLAEQIGRAHV